MCTVDVTASVEAKESLSNDSKHCICCSKPQVVSAKVTTATAAPSSRAHPVPIRQAPTNRLPPKAKMPRLRGSNTKPTASLSAPRHLRPPSRSHNTPCPLLQLANDVDPLPHLATAHPSIVYHTRDTHEMINRHLVSAPRPGHPQLFLHLLHPLMPKPTHTCHGGSSILSLQRRSGPQRPSFGVVLTAKHRRQSKAPSNRTPVAAVDGAWLDEPRRMSVRLEHEHFVPMDEFHITDIVPVS